MSVALLQEVRFAIGFKQQTDLVTPLIAADMVSLRQTNSELIQAQPINEDDAADYGKGVYPTQTFPSHWNASGPFNGRLSAEALAIITGFALGAYTSKAPTTGAGGFLYTYDEPVFATAGLDLPTTTMAVQIRTGGSAITDKAIVGVACEELGLTFRLGPGRDNAGFTSQWIGTGQNAKPSTIVIPAPYAEHSMNAGGITSLTLLGFNYLTNKRFVSLDFKWKNNIREGSSKFPGSGSQGGYQISGRLRRGTPTITLTAVVECDSGSSEEDLLLAQTTGTGVIQVVGAQVGAGPEFFGWKITFHKLSVKSSPISDSDGIAAYQLEYFILQDSSTGLCTIEAITDLDDILTVA